MLSTLMNWVNEIPPVEQPTRFGNQAFRTWIKRVKEVGEVLACLTAGLVN